MINDLPKGSDPPPADVSVTRDRVVVVTGATGRLGRALADALPREGRTVVLVGRDRGKLAAARLACAAHDPKVHVDTVLGDLSTRAGVEHVAGEIESRWQHVDALIHAAVTMPHYRQESDDGIEMQLAVNHLAPFALTNLLLEPLRRDGEGRVFVVSDSAWRRGTVDLDNLQAHHGYGLFGWKQYANTRRMAVLFVDELARRTAGTGIVALAVGPDRPLDLLDTPVTELATTPMRPLLRAPESSARNLARWLDDPELSGRSGAWIDRHAPSALPLDSNDRAIASALWRVSAELTGLASN